jgi:hypothetical protein
VSEGQANAPPDAAARDRLRRKALSWLQAELAAWKALLPGAKPDLRADIDRALRRWQQDTDLVGVRDPAALARLPAAERASWQRLWADVARLLTPDGPGASELPDDVFAQP